MRNFFKALTTRKAKRTENGCSICQTYTQDDYNYCMRCGSRFIGIIEHMKIHFKYHVRKPR